MKKIALILLCLAFCINTFSQLVTEQTKDDAYIAPTKLITDKWWYTGEEEHWEGLPWGFFGSSNYLNKGYAYVATNLYFNSNGTCKIIYKVRTNHEYYYDNTTSLKEVKYTFYTISLMGKWTRQKGTLKWTANKMSAKCNYTMLEDVKKENLSIRKKDDVTRWESIIVRNISREDESKSYGFLTNSLSINRLDNEYMIIGDYKPLVLVNKKNACGMVKIESSPTHADVYIDGKKEGITNGFIRQQTCGEHTYRIAEDGYNDITGTFTIEEDCLKIISVQLTENKKENRIISEDEIESMPSFPGGEAALLKYLTKNLRYPAVAEENGIQGRVICEFIVHKDGCISDIKVIRSVDTSVDREAVRLIKSMPKWNPGTLKNGETFDTRYTLPVIFSLQ